MGAGVRPPKNNMGGGEAEVEAHLGHVQKLPALAKAVGCQTVQREDASRALVQAIGALSRSLGIFVGFRLWWGTAPLRCSGHSIVLDMI